MKILIVDDEALARQRLRSLLGELGGNHKVIEADNGLVALEVIQRENPDVVLLDIRMPLMDGLEVAHHLTAGEAPPAIIFTTAYQKHALEAFEIHAVDYLLKPVRRERLQDALKRARILRRGQVDTLRRENGLVSSRTHLSATRQGGNIQLVPVEDVRYLKAEHKYIIAAWPKGELLLDEPLKALEKEFGELFIRVHRNALAAVRYIDGLVRDESGGLTLTLRDMSEGLQVSRRHASEIRRLLRP